MTFALMNSLSGTGYAGSPERAYRRATYQPGFSQTFLLHSLEQKESCFDDHL